MTAELYVCMTSGVEGPKIELTQEQAQEVAKLALQLNTPWTGSSLVTNGLGPEHYVVAWMDDYTTEVIGIRTNFFGFVSLWKRHDTDWHDFHDTVGLWGYLAPFAAQAYQNWIKQYLPPKTGNSNP